MFQYTMGRILLTQFANTKHGVENKIKTAKYM